MDHQGLAALAPERSDPFLSRLPARVEVYCVGGAVRDCLLGEPALDRDYLVTGASPDDMAGAGFRPVGRDFPVFLHPTTQAEYALARTERKSGQGYKGFVFYTGPEVSLEEDLLRRDLRINAMAVDSGGRLHDPLGGYEDLKRGILRHISPAFREDPLRLLRLARFCARWPHFAVADETFALCQQVVADQELQVLVAERVWTELEKGLQSAEPARMMALLESLSAWPSLVGTHGVSLDQGAAMAELTEAKRRGVPVGTLAGLLFSKWPAGRLSAVLPKQVLDWQRLLSAGLAKPSWIKQLQHPSPPDALEQTAREILHWAEEGDLFRRPERALPLLVLADPRHQGALTLIQGLISLPVGLAAQSAARDHLSVPLAVQSHRLAWLMEQLARAQD